MHGLRASAAAMAVLLVTAACSAVQTAATPAAEPSPTSQSVAEPTVTPTATAVPAAEELSLRGPACPDGFEEEEMVSQQAELAVGGTLTLTLGATPSIPCGWLAATISDEEVVQQTGRRTEWPAEGVTPMPGAPGVERWVLEAVEEGTSTVSPECTCLGERGADGGA